MSGASKVFAILCFITLNKSFAINSIEKNLDLSANETDLADITEETLAFSSNKLINNSPTASLVYKVDGDIVDHVRENDVVTVTATFNHEINDAITMIIDGHGAQDFNGGMTRVSSTVYNYTYTVDSASGVQNFLFENGQDLEGNLVTPDPSSGAFIHHNPSVLNYSYEDFELNNPNAVKINIIYLTNDITLSNLPVDSNGVEWGMAQVEELISESNTAFNELYDASNWPGFELGRITKAYNTSHYNTENPHGVLFDISTQPVAQKDYLNIVIVKVNREVSNVAGTTFQNSSTRSTNGTTLVLSSVDEGMVPIHEIGHVIGLPHWTGNGWPPPHGELPLQDGSVMGFTSLNHSGAESNYMGSWGSNSTDSFVDINGNDAAVSLYLTSKPQTFNTPAFGNIGSEVFRSWLIANEYILSNAPATGYVGHDTSLSVASDWLSEGVNEFSSLPAQAFPKIVASQNENNNYAAVSFLNDTGSQLSYSYRDNNSVWGPVTTIQGVDGDFHSSEMAMSSNGDVIIITETWVEGAIKVFSKDIEDVSWTNSLVISDPGTSDLRNSRAKVSVNASGNAVAVWLRNDNNMSQIVFKERVADSWSNATVLSLNDSKNELPSIAYNNNGDVLVSWQQWNANSFKYEVVGKFRNGATNNWSSLENYGNPDSTAGFSQVAIDADGNAIVYWRQAGFSEYIECCTPKPRSGFLNVRYRNFNGTLEEAVQLTDTEKDAFNGATFHNENRVVFLEDGTAAATWWINDGTNPGTIYSSAMTSKNVWTTPVALSNSGHNATMSKIAPGKGGDYSVIWQRPDGLNTRIQTRTYHASTSNWSAISTLSDSNYDAIWGDIASDGDNQLSAIWVRNDGTKHIPEVKRFSLNPFITETTITADNSSISVSFNEAVYNAIGAAGALEANDFTLSITGGTATIASTTPTSISSNENTYTLGVSLTGIPDGTETLTVVPADSGVIFDSADNAASTSQNNNNVALNDMTSHTASLVYTINGSSVSSVTEGDVVLITATFNQEIEDNPIVQISGSGVNNISVSNMTKVNNKEYTYSWTVTTGSGVQNFELETGTNSEGTVIAATPSSGATIIVVNNISPTATLNYTIATPIGPQNAESSVNAAKENDVVTITALFSEAMADFPSVQISGTGMDTFNPINMTKVSSTEYTYDWRAVSGDGIQNFTLGTGKDLGGDIITPTPSSGASIIIDNTQPMVGLVYTINGNTVNTVRQGDQVLITATFNEAISDDGIKINGYGSTTVPFSDMTKVSTTEYTYLWTVGAGNGNTDFGLGYGTDTVGNEITNDYMTGRSILVDNSSPTALIDWEAVTTVAPGSVITVYVTFSETMANSPVPQISGSGANTVAPNDLIQHYLSTYKYIWTVGENTGTQTFSVSTGTDLAGNVVEETLTSGGSMLIDILPTAALSYTVNGTAVSSTVKQGDEVLITATFNKDMADSPVVQIYAEGLNEMSPSDMTKINSTSYSYTLTVGSGNGNQYFRMATGTDLAGTPIETYPTSGETLIIDNTPPTITLLGDPIVNIEVGATYTDAGADADDNVDGPVITDNIVAVSTVNTAIVGVYTVTYNVNDAAGNAATQVTRTVNVTGDETNPVITLTGDVTVTIEVGTDYTDAGATATDNSDGDLTSSIVTVSTVNTAIIGSYTVTYNVSDTAGNAATQVTRTVNVVDTTVPVITLSGDATVTIEVGALYTDAGATATDNFDGDLTSSIVTVSTVNTAIAGSYTVTYNVSDTAGNAATQVTRTVNVEDTTIPIIILEGDATVTIEVGTNYTDAGATATDNVDGDITSSIVVTGTADVNVLGNYTIIYDVSDAAGNEAIQVTRTVHVVDTTIPVITLEGDATVTVEVGSEYTDAGATATDNYDGNITYDITIVNPVNISVVGSYTVTYNVSDTVGNTATQITRTVNVVDTTVPVITLSGDATVTIWVGAVYIDAGATATDNYDGNITDNITIVNPVNTSAAGSYTVTYNVSDTSGNEATQVTRTVNVEDTTIPIITLEGDAIVTIEVGTDYTDAGATATDNSDGDLTSSIVTVSTVNTAIVGSYTVTYNVSDTAGNAATQVTRTVHVEDTTIPIITLVGDATVTIEVGTNYTDAGATATDNVDGDITSSIVVTGTADVNVLGNYTIIYDVSDAAGNEATQVTRTVHVVDTTIPVITLEGDATVTVEVGSEYTDAGATATDNSDGDLTSSIVTVSTVNTTIVGVYSVRYNVADTSGNEATQVTRTVHVEDTTIPVITLVGDATVTIEVGTDYTDAGATAWDNYDGNITDNITIVNSVNTNVVGSYTVTYNISDTAGNAATQVTRIVSVDNMVDDNTAPVITLEGDATVTIEVGTNYTDAGATATDNVDGDITSSIVVTGTVDVNVLGNYTIIYDVSDAAGNEATQVTRTVHVVDTTIPVITIEGDATVTVEVGSEYTDAGATATDNSDGDLTSSIVTVSTVNTAIVGVYSVRYNVADTSGNEATQVTRTVHVEDTTIPVITLVGDATVTIEVGTDYTDLGAIATDNVDGDITGNITTVNPVDTSVVGSYTVTYNVSDTAGNAATQITRTVTITADTTIPVITLVGTNPQSIELGTAYSELGAIATDNIDGNITENIVIDATAVNVNAPGDYTVTYNVSDSTGNIAEEKTRIVNVVDTSDPVPPVIILLGSASVFVELGTDYTDAGATASDGIGGNITSSIVITDTVDTNNVGVYTISYNVNDAEGNPATQATRTVTVVNYSVPVITLLGDAIISLRNGDSYVDAGATAEDSSDGTLTNYIETVNPVNIYVNGTYKITYNVSNSSGTPAIPVTRTVVVTYDENYCDFSENFEELPLIGWTILNSNTESNNITLTDATSMDGNYSLRFSSKDEDSAYDQYLISPEFTPSDIEKRISFWYLASEVDEVEVFKVGWSTTGNNLDSDFTWSDEIIAESADDLNDMFEYSKDDLPIGTKYVAIHYYSDNKNHLYIDRFCLLASPEGGYNSGITLLGAEDVSIELGTSYTDAGAIAFTEGGVNITANIVTINPVDENLEGIYTITYNVSDPEGNAATEVTRTVTVFTSMWNGSVDNNWNTAANWSSNAVPTASASVRIPRTGITNFPTALTDVNIHAITLESGASLIAAATFSGSLTYKRNLHLVDNWHFITSPVEGASLANVISNTDLRTGTGTNIGISNYDNNVPGWVYHSTTSSGTMESAKGYAVLVNSGDIFFTGTMPIGPIDKSLTLGQDGWNLIGNPYPSYLAINNSAHAINFLDVNSSSLSNNFSSIYLWDVLDTQSGIKVVNHATESFDIAPGQGFFVNVDSDGNSVSFTNEMQSHQAIENFFRSPESTPTIVLAIDNTEDVETTTIKYFESTTAGLDIGYDAGAFNAGGESNFKLNTHLVEDSEGIDFMLQCLSTNEYETSVVPLAVKAEAGLEIVFSVEASNLPEGIKVFLEDKTTNTYTRLDEDNSEYIVTLTEAENGIGRFYLHTKSSVLNINDPYLNVISIYKKNSSTIRIVGLAEGATNFKLFNTLGVPVKKTSFKAERVFDIEIPKLPAGIYIVQLENENRIVNKKLFLE